MLKFYMDHELEILWPEMDRRMYDREWRMYVFCFRTMLCLGSRIWETTQIRVEDCYEDHVHIRFGKGEGLIEGEFKERRPTVHPAIFRPYYREYLDSLRANQEWLFPRKRLHKHYAVRHRGTGNKKQNPRTVHVTTVEKRWKKFCALIDLRYLPPHEAFRKTFATWFHGDMDRHDMMDQLGHKDYKTTDKIYRGSVPGRAFRDYQPPVRWKILAAEMASELEKKRTRHLRVVG